MLDGKLLIRFLTHIVKEHHLQLQETKLQKTQEEAVEYYDYYGFNIFPTMNEIEEIIKEEEKKIEEHKINPEWEQPHDKWPRDYDISRKEVDEC